MATSIYLDDETREVLKIIKEKNTGFNFSAFIKFCLIEKGGKISELDGATILKNKRDVELKIQNLENEVNYWEEVYTDFKVQEEVKKKESIENENEEERKKRIKEEAKRNIMETFEEVSKREMTEEEYKNYSENRSSYRNIWSFIERKVKTDE